ncbi:MAG: phosphotriesterase [Solirubrobacterales bacterium]|nr:phosphotriesterase [Solirubrobacterales bacterium]
MEQIPTTAGPIDLAALDRILVHEHLLTAHEGIRFQWPHLVDAQGEQDAAVTQVRAAQGHGVQAICDPAVLDLARDVRLSLAVTEATGMPIVMATGVYGQHYTFLPHYFQTREVGALADCFAHDLEVGIQGTEVRAAFLKCAADEPGITPDVDKVHRAVAEASKRTGAPIMVHSHPVTRTGLASMAIFAEEGIDPARVLVAHTGDTDDLDYIEELLQTGCTIGMDRYGLDIFLPEDRRNATLVALVERGHADRMVLGQDACATIDWFPADVVKAMAPNWSFTHIFEAVLPALLTAGVTQEQLDAMLGANVRRWLGA